MKSFHTRHWPDPGDKITETGKCTFSLSNKDELDESRYFVGKAVGRRTFGFNSNTGSIDLNSNTGTSHKGDEIFFPYRVGGTKWFFVKRHVLCRALYNNKSSEVSLGVLLGGFGYFRRGFV